MTPEKTYENIVAMLNEYDRASGFTAAGEVVSKPWEWTDNNIFPFYASAARMLIDCREQMDKKHTPAARMAAVKRLCKSAMGTNDRRLAGIFQNRGKYAICNGYMFVRLADDIPALPHVDTEKVMPLDLEKCTPPSEMFVAVAELPAVADLKAYIAKCKAIGGKDHKISYELPNGVYVNPQSLLDMIQIFPDAVAHITGPTAPIYFESADGDGVLMPVHPKTAKVA